jgi:hypothetical protein
MNCYVSLNLETTPNWFYTLWLKIMDLENTNITIWPPPVGRANAANDFSGLEMNGWLKLPSNASEFAGVNWGPILDTRWNGIIEFVQFKQKCSKPAW